MSFAALGLNSTLLQTLNQLGYEQPTPIQAQAIPVVLQGKDIMAGAQTGTGKTAAFALPIIDKLLAKPASTLDKKQLAALVLTPTRELAQQVHNNFCQYAESTELKIEIAYGGASLTPQINRLKDGADVLVATPGRLIDLMFKGVVDLAHLQFLVFDEADRMLDMGFINDIERILKRVPEQRQTMLFSATFDSSIFKLSKSILKNPTLIEVDDRNTAATSVEQIVYQVDEDRKRELTSYLIGSKNWQQVLIFTRTKQGADNLAKEMIKDGIKTQVIHGDKTQGRRDAALADFKSGEVRALVATDVAARGIDIQQLQYVINYELPYAAEDYIHRIGRTGRAGNSGTAITLVSEDENYLLEDIEALLDQRLAPQWLAGYEPDPTKNTNSRKNSRAAEKRRAKQRAMPKKRTGNKPKARKF